MICGDNHFCGFLLMSGMVALVFWLPAYLIALLIWKDHP